MTVRDALLLRPLCQPVLDAELARHRDHAPHLVGVDLEPVLAFCLERVVFGLVPVALRLEAPPAF